MSLLPEDALVEGAHTTVVKWWVVAPFHEDAYYFYFVRYDALNGDVQTAEYWADGEWTQYQPADTIKPFLILPGYVAMLIAQTDPDVHQKAVDWMRDTCLEILRLAQEAGEEGFTTGLES